MGKKAIQKLWQTKKKNQKRKRIVTQNCAQTKGKELQANNEKKNKYKLAHIYIVRGIYYIVCAENNSKYSADKSQDNWTGGHLETRSAAGALGWNAVAVVAVAAVQTDLDRSRWKTWAVRSSICHQWSPCHYSGQLYSRT